MRRSAGAAPRGAQVNVHRARGVVLLREGGVETADGTDAKLLRAVLALAWIAEKSGLRGHAVVEVKWAANRHLVEKLGGARVEVLASREFQARLLLVCARQPGLSFVYDDLLGFEGSEFHTAAFPELAGATLGAVVHRFRTACVVGVVEAANEGHVTLNPPDTYVLQADDRLIMLAEDEESVVLAPDAPVARQPARARQRMRPACGVTAPLSARVARVQSSARAARRAAIGSGRPRALALRLAQTGEQGRLVARKGALCFQSSTDCSRHHTARAAGALRQVLVLGWRRGAAQACELPPRPPPAVSPARVQAGSILSTARE